MDKENIKKVIKSIKRLLNKYNDLGIEPAIRANLTRQIKILEKEIK